MKFFRILVMVFLLAATMLACNATSTPVPVTDSPTAVALATTAVPTSTTGMPSSTPISPTYTLTVSPSISPTASPTTNLPPAPSATPSPQIISTATTVTTLAPTAEPTAGPSPSPSTWVNLSIPTDTWLVSPPAGAADEPLLGANSIAVNDVVVAAGTNGNGVLLSEDSGRTWRWSTAGLPDEPIKKTVVAETELAAIMDNGQVYRSQDNGQTWALLPNLPGIESLIYSPNYTYDGLMLAVQTGALVRSTDRGVTWTPVLPANGCTLAVTLSAHFAADEVVYATRCDHIARSADGGATWQDVPVESMEQDFVDFCSLDVESIWGEMLLVLGREWGYPLISPDGGRNWQNAYGQDPPFGTASLHRVLFGPDGALYTYGNFPFMHGSYLWRSVNEGQSWETIVKADNISDFVLGKDGSMWLASPDGIFRARAGRWQLMHTGGNRQSLLEDVNERVVVVRRGTGKYSSAAMLFEKVEDRWRLADREPFQNGPIQVYVAPNYFEERLVIVLDQDYGGAISVVTWRPEAEEPLKTIEDIPTGRGPVSHQVTFADDYASSGRIDLRHSTGALYFSTDFGYTWERLPAGEPGACEREPVSGFGSLWHNNAGIRDLLGCPLEDEQAYSGLVQAFEHGELLRLDSATVEWDTTIYILVPDWQGAPAWNTQPHYDTGEFVMEPPPGLFSPDPVFHTAWREGNCCLPNWEITQFVLGWATAPAEMLDTARQEFEGGIMLWRGDRDEIVVLYHTDDAMPYLVFPD